MARMVTVGAAQVAVTADVNENVHKVAAFLAAARRRRVQLLVFPETMLSGYGPSHWKEREPDPRMLRRRMDDVAALVRKARVAAVLGTSDRRAGRWYNAAYFLDSTGRRIARYAKMHLTGGDAEVYAPGQSLDVVRWRGIRFGQQICLDMRFPESWRLLRLKGAQVVLHSVAAFGSDAWKVPVLEGTLRCRAAENGLMIVSANAAGPIQMVASAIVDGRGLLLAQANREIEELIVAPLDLTRPRTTYDAQRRTDSYLLREVKTGRWY
jgi:predicted amidohydrolase